MQTRQTMPVLFTRHSRNAKTGPIAVTTTGKQSCPTDCVFMGNGCYAETGPLGWLWSGLSSVQAGDKFKQGNGTQQAISWSDMCERIKREIYKGEVWRHNQAGDLPRVADTGKIDAAMVAELVKANKGKRGFTFTHHNVLQDRDNREIVRHANKNGFTVNLSANNLNHADQLKALAIAPVVCVLPDTSGIGRDETPTAYKARIGKIATPAGNSVIVCPATYQDTMTCHACKICATFRKAIVGFPAHGSGRRKATMAMGSK